MLWRELILRKKQTLIQIGFQLHNLLILVRRMKNSSYDIDENEVSVVGFKQKIFSPDNDGVDDRLIINFDLEKSGYVANIRIYNSYGREIRRLASNLTLSTTDELFWDGLLASKERASIGVYVLYFELFHPDGDVKTYKKTCVLGGSLNKNIALVVLN